ncbi:piercer of microtubule wall 2 protein [Mirounga angustirostris]|uniref:piercer of microtubule wall 2 protein n=1 Tax=Mirounga angustirostris TaxID=9716 RepID=UPI0023E3C35D|nr:piercer of microtubule wall 2 protein [Mirounga angustirostris]
MSGTGGGKNYDSRRGAQPALARRQEARRGGSDPHNIRAPAERGSALDLVKRLLPSAHWSSCHPLPGKTAFAEKIYKEDTENDRDKKCASASNSGTEVKPEQVPPCVNPGNPVFSCMLDPKTLLTATSLSKPKMIMYKTSSCNYGEFLPMPQFFPCSYTPREQVFSSHIRATGFYQNNSLNTTPDRTRTLDFPNFQHTL